MVISQRHQNNFHIIIVLHQRCLNCSECFRDNSCSYMQLQHQVTHRNGAIKHIFYNWIRSTEGLSADCSLFILFAPCACSSSSGCTHFKSFCIVFEHVGFIYICRLYFPPECQVRPQFCYATNNIKENIPNIWHINQQNRKGGQTRLFDKNDNANYAPSYHNGRFYQWLRLPF